MRLVLSILLCVLAPIIAGCAVGIVPALSTSTETVSSPIASESIWPSRLGTANGIIVGDTRPITNWRAARVPNGEQLTPYEIEAQQYEEFAEKSGTNLSPSFEIGGGFIVIPYIKDGKPADGKQHFNFISAERDQNTGQAKVQRTWFTYDEPDDAEPIGLAILMTGIFATPRDVTDRAERGLLQRGWAVLRMLSPPSRMTEHIQYTIDSCDPELVVEVIAADLDNRAAEVAYSVHAATEHVLDQSQELASLPRVIIGMSGTAISLPTIVAYEPDVYDAAVFIGGGANSFRIAEQSSYIDMIDSIRTKYIPCEQEANNDISEEELYLDFSNLDGVHTAKAMAGIPTLMIHGTRDTAVPADTGDLLWELLDKPDRWTMPVGHELLFGAIPFRMVAILDWLEANTDQDGAK